MPLPFTAEQKQTAFWCLVWLAFFVLLYALGPVLTPFIAAAIIAYALGGGVDYFCRLQIGPWHMPRGVAVVVVMVLFLAAASALVLIVIPVLTTEIPLLQAQFPVFLTKLDALLRPHLANYGVKVKIDGSGIRNLVTAQMAGSNDDVWTRVITSARIGGSALLGWAATLILIPVVLFYLLLDWHRLLGQISNAVPRRFVAQAVSAGHEVNVLLAQYLRGQLLVMLVLALYYSAALAMLGLDVALPVGILTGILVFIPYLGFGLGLALAVIAAMLQFPDWTGLLWVGITYGVGQVLEGFFLTPRLVGERIGLNPLAVIFALLAFGQLFGFVGVLLALPASAVLMVAFRHLRHHYLRSSFYNA